MIISEKKAIEEISKITQNHNNFFILGCGECATSCKTGGFEEVIEMETFLKGAGKNVNGSGVCETSCDERKLKKFIRDNKENIEKSDCFIVLSCGAGAQVLRRNSDREILIGINTMFLGMIERLGNFEEYCMQCGNCTISHTFGFCTKTRCSKGLVNGPCGNAKNGMCEQRSSKKCVWIEIFDFLKTKNKIKEFLNINIANDYTKLNRPRKMEKFKNIM